jgi:hypothetical protein
MKGLVCPVSFREINQNASRFSVFILAVAIEIFLLTGNIWFMVGVAVDYAFRIFEPVKYSPITFISDMIFKLPFLPVKKVNKGPKVFASRMGFTFAIISVGFFWIMPEVSVVFAIVLLVCTFLDAVFNVCFGCLIYHYLIYPFYSDN